MLRRQSRRFARLLARAFESSAAARSVCSHALSIQRAKRVRVELERMIDRRVLLHRATHHHARMARRFVGNAQDQAIFVQAGEHVAVHERARTTEHLATLDAPRRQAAHRRSAAPIRRAPSSRQLMARAFAVRARPVEVGACGAMTRIDRAYPRRAGMRGVPIDDRAVSRSTPAAGMTSASRPGARPWRAKKPQSGRPR